MKKNKNSSLWGRTWLKNTSLSKIAIYLFLNLCEGSFFSSYGKRVQLSEENNQNLTILEFFVGHFRLAGSGPVKFHRYNDWFKIPLNPDELQGRRGFNYNSHKRQCRSFFWLNLGRKTNLQWRSFTVVTSLLRSSQVLINLRITYWCTLSRFLSVVHIVWNCFQVRQVLKHIFTCILERNLIAALIAQNICASKGSYKRPHWWETLLCSLF